MFKNIKRIVWGFPKQNNAGAEQFLDPTSPDIAVRKDPEPPALMAVAIAESKVAFHWPARYNDQQGTVMTVN
jgi:hypothetical protein